MILAAAVRMKVATVVGVGILALVSLAPTAGAATETVIYSFQNNGQDGYYPAAALTSVGNALYGTTASGGTGRCIDGCGTVFSIDAGTGAETVLYSLRDRGPQGSQPGSLVKAGSVLVGTTADAGHRSEGSLFSLNLKTGAFKTRYSFCNLDNCTDGATPSSELLDWDGALYGATSSGGPQGTEGSGVAFSLDPKSGTEKPLYSFCHRKDCADGADPSGGMIRIKRKLYGTTQYGGTGCSAYNNTCGTLYSINPATGKEVVFYSFCSQQSCADGAIPQGNLIESSGTLYGVTEYGGSGATGTCSFYLPGCGTVFSVDPATGAETALHAFAQNGADGLQPQSGLVAVNGLLYGTTVLGGANGRGAVYSVDPATGDEAIIYSFCSQKGCPDGQFPEAGLLNVNGTLYGTTNLGGTGTCANGSYKGCGVVFAITP